MTTRHSPTDPNIDVAATSVFGKILSADDADRIAHTFKALADPTRIRLLSLIAASPDGKACICDLTEPVGLSQPTVSHHMKLLVAAGLATREQQGRWAYYRVVRDALYRAAQVIQIPDLTLDSRDTDPCTCDLHRGVVDTTKAATVSTTTCMRPARPKPWAS